jgi:Tfp pilus assembly protein PilO
LIIEIQELATEAGIDLTSIKPAVPVSAGEFSELKMEIQMAGYFFDSVDFLYRLENFPREIKVLAVAIAAGPKGLPQLSITMQANAFILVTGQATAPPAATAPAQVSPPPTTEGGT